MKKTPWDSDQIFRWCLFPPFFFKLCLCLTAVQSVLHKDQKSFVPISFQTISACFTIYRLGHFDLGCVVCICLFLNWAYCCCKRFFVYLAFCFCFWTRQFGYSMLSRFRPTLPCAKQSCTTLFVTRTFEFYIWPFLSLFL